MAYTYSEEELDLVSQYACQSNPKQYRCKLNSLLNINENSYRVFNSFLRSRCKELPDKQLTSVAGLKEFIHNIEVLFEVACKYGSDNKFPDQLYREGILAQDAFYNDMQNVITNQFFSCSKNERETTVFKTEDSIPMTICSNGLYTPFIDVNILLRSSHYFTDEKEIVIPPFLNMSVLDYQEGIRALLMMDSLVVFDDLEDVSISDDILDNIIKIYSKMKKNPEDIELYDRYTNLVYEYIKTNCYKLYKKYEEEYMDRRLFSRVRGI